MRAHALTALAVAALLALACAGEDGPDLLGLPPNHPALDASTSLQPEALADLALARARRGGQWLAAVSQPGGAFAYTYDPLKDAYDLNEYNEVRHAGVTYSMFQLYAATRDPAILNAAEAAARYIEANSHPLPGAPGRTFAYQGQTKLGGQALAIVALIERRRALKSTSYDGLIRELATMLLIMERSDEEGAFYNSYHLTKDELRLTPASNFYPGEALLALARLSADFGDGEYLGAALAAADYLIHRRDGDIPALGRIPREDHWLVLALSEMYEVRRNPDYLTVVWLQADSMARNQWQAADDPLRAGASRLSQPVNFTTAATKGEAHVAAWRLALLAGDIARAQRYSEAALRTAQLAMRVQYLADNATAFRQPAKTIGGWAFGPKSHSIRIDNVQHNVSLLLGVWSLTVAPVPAPPAPRTP